MVYSDSTREQRARLSPRCHQVRAVRAPTQGRRLKSRRERLPIAPSRGFPCESCTCALVLCRAQASKLVVGSLEPADIGVVPSRQTRPVVVHMLQ